MSSWHRTPPQAPRREWCKWHAGWFPETDAILVAVIPNDAGMDYGQYACNGCAEEHGILPADDSGQVRYAEQAAAEAIPR